MLRSALILSAWRWWRVGRLMEAAERARQAGQLHRASALLDQAGVLMRELRAGSRPVLLAGKNLSSRRFGVRSGPIGKTFPHERAGNDDA